MSQYQNDPIIQLPNLYINGLTANVDPVSLTKIVISSGIARDSQNVMDITVGSANVQNNTTNGPLIINSQINGINGLDTGTLGTNTLYAVYVIADSRYRLPTAAIMALGSQSAPIMPFGYDSYRKIGYVWSINPTTLANCYTVGESNSRKMMSAYNPVLVTAGTSTTFDFVSASTYVPKIENLEIYLQAVFQPVAAGDTLELAYAADGLSSYVFIAPVAAGTAFSYTYPSILNQFSVPDADFGFKYKVSAGIVDITVAGFSFTV